jgi:hypothetical protein
MQTEKKLNWRQQLRRKLGLVKKTEFKLSNRDVFIKKHKINVSDKELDAYILLIGGKVDSREGVRSFLFNKKEKALAVQKISAKIANL